MAPARSRHVLVTGFLPFAGGDHNPSQIVAEAVAAAPPPGVRITLRILSVSWARAFAPVAEAWTTGAFDGVLHLGLGTGRTHIEVERFAVNRRTAPIADEDGAPDPDSPVVPGGPAAYGISADADALVAAGRRVTPLVRTSCHAGTFLCNDLYYRSLRRAARCRPRPPVAFVHLPAFLEHGGAVPRELQTEAVRQMARALRVP